MVKAEGPRSEIESSSSENTVGPIHDKGRVVDEQVMKMCGIVMEQIGHPCCKNR